MSVKEALKELPSFNKNNFARIHDGEKQFTSSKRLPVHVPTKEYKSNQIVTEKLNVILKFLHTNPPKENNKRDNRNEINPAPKKKMKIEKK